MGKRVDEFNAFRAKMNERILAEDNRVIKRVFSVDSLTYQDGALSAKTKELLDTNSLVEEFMLLANISVARKIYETFPQTALLRRHAAPPATNFDELASQLKAKRGFELHVRGILGCILRAL